MNTENMLSITSVEKDSKGEISSYKLSNGKVVDKQEGVELAKQGKIDGVLVAHSKTGEEYLRTVGDGNPSNNLTNLISKEYNEIH
ncbi:DUF3892 domain-containing protein [Hathewaya histolytica]|uniref:DUF3892 domain-containing protein n=1 Tax=Hathewaya histolytica TaxID=1498 RepID=A0A4U9RBR2_HATHI|nr:DUF3892 domain-containing protein [Hathewaya histolytica]VTQ86120.1 Uncharacterised protein [Hathewaya histolytica]